jgi:parallel beta-helix repeat protein
MKTIALGRSLALGFVILFAGAFVVPSVVSATIIYVDDDNTTGPWDGTPEHPYRRIKDGEMYASFGDTVYVFNGFYYENVRVDISISLIGEDKDSTVIDGDGNHYEDVVYIAIDSVSISGFTIQNSGRRSDDAGIDIRSSNNTVSENIIRDNLFGIYLHGYSGNIISGNDITENDKDGISLGASSHNTIISGNSIANNGYDGIDIAYSDTSTITGNNITSNSRDGVYLFGSDHNNITGNTMTNDGIYMTNSSDNNTISGDTIINGRIYVRGWSNNNIISGNTVTTDGIYLENSYGNTIADHDLVSNGITITGDALYRWNSHTIENNTLNGMPISYYKDTSGVVVPANTAQLILANCTNFTVQNLNISNAFRGIQLGYSSSNTISGNTITNSHDGIYLYDSDTNSITGNTITDNSGEGIYLLNSSNNNITQDTVGNNNYGIYLG